MLAIHYCEGNKMFTMLSAFAFSWKITSSIHLLGFEFPAKTTWQPWILLQGNHPVIKVLKSQAIFCKSVSHYYQNLYWFVDVMVKELNE